MCGWNQCPPSKILIAIPRRRCYCSAMRILRIIAGTIVGYAFSLATSLAWFLLTHHPDPAAPASTRYLIACGVDAFIFSILAGWIAALVGGSRISAWGVALIVAIFSIWNIVELHGRPGGSLATTYISLFLMTPAILFGGYLWRKRAA